MNTSPSRRKGFTLIEMLVVIAIIALLAAILVPAVTGALAKAQRTKTMATVGGIYKLVFSAQLDADAAGSGQSYFPDTGDYTTSTEYFEAMLDTIADGGLEALPKEPSFFTAPGVTGISSTDDLTADSNPWSVVTGLSATSTSGLPFIISRNLNETALNDWSGDETATLANVGTGTYEKPFDDQALVLVRSGGNSGVAIERKQFLWRILNPSSDDNDIMAPGS